jgi:uncharacterized protein (DUF924 family)
VSSELRETPDGILEFWFEGAAEDPSKAMQRSAFWFQASADVDEDISRRFSALLQRAARGDLAAWEQAAPSCLALVILLDQFPRNIYRGMAEAFQYDSKALDVATRGVAAGYLEQLSPAEQRMFVLPYEHCEDISVQRAGIELFEGIVDRVSTEWELSTRGSLGFARRHLEIIERFGRFPHRNDVLGRESTVAEQAYLVDGGESFGQ